MTQSAFHIAQPEVQKTAVIFAAPHSGKEYTQAFLAQSALDLTQLRSSEDAFIDQLFAAAPLYGAVFLSARMPRAYVDLNRAADELDPVLIADAPPHLRVSPRAGMGLGVIPRVVARGRHIYSGTLLMAEVEARLQDVWYPYHSRLRHLMEQTRADFGRAILVDCHSMPHQSLALYGGWRAAKPHIVIGDYYGTSAAPEIVDHIETAFTKAGLRVARNKPFAGAYIVQHYGRPSRNFHTVQIEIDRSLYMDEKNVTPLKAFEDFKQRINGVIADICRIEGAKGEARLAGGATL